MKFSKARLSSFGRQLIKTGALAVPFSGLALALCSVGANGAAAQAKTPALPSAAPRSATAVGAGVGAGMVAGTARDYKLGSDDVLSVTVQRHPEFSVPMATVPVSGLLTVPVIGEVKVTGKTLEQLDEEITRRFKVRLLKPEVAVELRQARPTPIYVVGQVQKPGIYDFKSGWHVTQALAAAGGLMVRADLVYATVSRGNKKIVDAALPPILSNPTRAQNVALKSGDTIQFYERVMQISEAGEVLKPGLYSVPLGNGAVEAVSLAGGPTADAALTRATVNRADGTVLPVNLFAALVQGNKKSNLKLKEGDLLVIPQFKERISVLGAVANPGFYGVEDGRRTTIADALAKAGGPKDNAALTKASLKRADGTVVPIDLYKILVKGDRENDVAVGQDDVITVPEARGVTVLGEVARPGTYKIEEGNAPHVSDALARSGGLNIKRCR